MNNFYFHGYSFDQILSVIIGLLKKCTNHAIKNKT